MYNIHGRNVNHMLPIAATLFRDLSLVHRVAPRGSVTLEITVPVVTTYERPLERVLFEPKRDANPFFHLFESLWILGGRDDVAWLAHFLPRIADYSDDGTVFHGAYGARMRYPVDQVQNVIEELRRDPDSRRAVIALWQPELDSGYTGKDMPCNCTITFKIRDGVLNMTVFNRSNDMVWGAYGANAVQFSFLQEYIAAFVGVPVGVYHQISDSFHVYENQPAWQAVRDLSLNVIDPYRSIHEARCYDGPPAGAPVRSYPLVLHTETFDAELALFSEIVQVSNRINRDVLIGTDHANIFFREVAAPLYNALRAVRAHRWGDAYGWVQECRATDWRLAADLWIRRRQAKASAA